MKLVALIEIELYRIGTVSPGGGFGGMGGRNVTRRRVVTDTSPEGLRQAVIETAIKEGEEAAALTRLEQVNNYHYSAEPGVCVFDVRQQNVHYSNAYAACKTFPALEIEGRFFRLDEVSQV